ncbi:MAG TPA: SDR family oxidoreductase [bacterium]|nr:SDR family oxidoreductase [bacterium]HPN45739.1 SDR family oxidoreductase [bacterium]
MKVLFIGGTGNISSAVSRLAVSRGIDLYLLNRGNRKVDIPDVNTIVGDISKPEMIKKVLGEQKWDVVVNWIAFKEADINRDIQLFAGKTAQYIFISSASAYQKPLSHPVITESTPLANPYWDYSRDKIACEERLNRAYRDEGFPITIVRPSLTFDTVIPVAIGSWDDYTIIDRMKKGKPIIVHGDGSSLWTITHARDFAKGFVGLLGHQQAIGHAFHITSDELLTWNQIYQTFADVIGVEANLVHIPSDFICEVADKIGQGWMRGNLFGDKAVSAIFDNSKIKTFVPGYVATIPFKIGIRHTIEWFEADAQRMVIREENNKFLDTVINAYKGGKNG